jgi:endoglucanase
VKNPFTVSIDSDKLLSHLALAIFLICLVLTGSAHAGCLDQKRLLGVNLAGAEFSTKNLPGLLYKDYIYPSRQDLAYFKSTGMNLVRVPFRWERLQHEPNTALTEADLAKLQQVVAWGREMDLCILLDMHNYGSYFGQTVGSDAVPTTAFIDVWIRLHEAFDDPASSAFGLMNEPAAIKVPQWLEIAQATVFALRRAGARNLLMVPSGRWSGAHEWARTFDGTSAEKAFRDFRDPQDNFVIELHQYADTNHSGTGRQCVTSDQLRSLMAPVTAWGLREKKRFFLGEFGTDASAECLATLRTQLDAMQDDRAWLGWSYWAAGPWWGSYPFSIAPQNKGEAKQLTVLREFLPKAPARPRAKHAIEP